MTSLPIEILQSGHKVLLQLSGGKDSIACLISLTVHNVQVEAIHFTHRYGYQTPTQMAMEICRKNNVKLHIFDITRDLENCFSDGFKKRPCRFCKSIMDRHTVDFAEKNGFHYICVGDTADDKTLINRIIEKEGGCRIISQYFNQNVSLPPDISIYRPLLSFSGKDIISFVKHHFPEFRRINDTGDKYFEYSREGCPLQYKDLGAPFTPELMDRLKEYNTICSEFATKKGIRATIHLPSEFIVTIPMGFEDECYHYLVEHGCTLKRDKTQSPFFAWQIFFIPGINLSDSETASESVTRFCERVGRIDGIIHLSDCGIQLECTDLSATLVTSQRYNASTLSLFSSFDIPLETLNNLCVEIYHTRQFTINKTFFPK